MTMAFSAPIARGFNHNVSHRGVIFHVQTEASQHARPRVTTHVFVGGRVVASRGGAEEIALASVAARMKDQHRALLRALIHDELALPSDLFASRVGQAALPTPQKQVRPSKHQAPPLRPRPQPSVPAIKGMREGELRLALDHFGLLAGLAPHTSTLRQLGTALAVLRGLDVGEGITLAVMDELLTLQRRLIETCRSSAPAPTPERVTALRRDASALATALLGSRTGAARRRPKAPRRERVH